MRASLWMSGIQKKMINLLGGNGKGGKLTNYVREEKDNVLHTRDTQLGRM